MKANAAGGVLRAAKALTFSTALLSAALVGDAALAQDAPPIGVQSGSAAVSIPQMPAPTLPEGTGRSDESSSSKAPLATSAEGCQSDVGKLQTRRMTLLQELNKIAKANKGKLDPVTACPKFRTLVAVEAEFRDYLVKNKDWCSIPDEVVETVQQSTTKDMLTSVKACQLAAQFKKAQAQAALGTVTQAQRLPAGPL